MSVDFFIHRPVFATVCSLLIILAGVPLFYLWKRLTRG